jgi:hypothetical protein
VRPAVFLLAALAVMALAFWAYSENYRTQSALDRVDRLQSQIARERQTLAVLRAEWAYLNRPARLNELAAMNFDRLRLLPLTPEQFVRTDQISYPMPEPEVTSLEGVTDGALIEAVAEQEP